MKTSNYKMLAYALIAVGLINWDYQRAHHNIFVISALAWIPGSVLLSSTFLKRFQNLGSKKNFLFLISTLSLIIFISQVTLK